MGRLRHPLVWIPISVALLALLIARTSPWQAAAIAAQLDLRPLGLAALLNVVVVWLWAVRSASLMAAVGHPLGWRALVPVVSFANTINNLTPASSGEVLRAALLRRLYDVPLERSIAVIVAERFWAIWVMVLSAGAAAVGTIVGASGEAVALAWLGALAGILLPSLAYAVGLRPGRVAERLATGRSPGGRIHRIADGLARADARLAAIVTNPRRAAAFVLSTAGVFLLFAAQLWLVLFALGAHVSLGGAWAAQGLAIIVGVLSALPFGLGAADVTLVVLLGLQGVQPATAGAAALLVRAITTLPLGIAGTASWVALSRRVPSAGDDAGVTVGPDAVRGTVDHGAR